MSLSELLKISEDLTVLENGDMVKVNFRDLKTNWIGRDDPFFSRIAPAKLNRFFLEEHLKKEIEIRNVLDEGTDLLNSGKYAKAIERFDCVIYYDADYQQALAGKSHALFNQGHFVKALRFFKRSKSEDIEYYKLLLEKSSAERDGFPKIKRNIYAGDEAASKGDFERAVEFYDKALANPSGFKDKILFKLLNKKGFALIRLERFDEALDAFDASVRVHENDQGYFGLGLCQYRLAMKCTYSLRRARRIEKPRLLFKAKIFNELGCYEDGLDCLDEFSANHFALDDDFITAIRERIVALDGLSMDSGREREILSRLGVKVN